MALSHISPTIRAGLKFLHDTRLFSSSFFFSELFLFSSSTCFFLIIIFSAYLAGERGSATKTMSPASNCCEARVEGIQIYNEAPVASSTTSPFVLECAARMYIQYNKYTGQTGLGYIIIHKLSLSCHNSCVIALFSEAPRCERCGISFPQQCRVAAPDPRAALARMQACIIPMSERVSSTIVRAHSYD